MEPIYWGNVPINCFWASHTQYLIHDILYDIRIEFYIQRHNPEYKPTFLGVQL